MSRLDPYLCDDIQFLHRAWFLGGSICTWFYIYIREMITDEDEPQSACADETGAKWQKGEFERLACFDARRVARWDVMLCEVDGVQRDCGWTEERASTEFCVPRFVWCLEIGRRQ